MILRVLRQIFKQRRTRAPSRRTSSAPPKPPFERSFRRAKPQSDIATPKKVRARSEAEVRSALDTLPKAKTIKVIDGDTVIVHQGRHPIRVRLDSIDCPEDGQEWGDIATFGLIKLIGGRHVHLETHGTDDYGRTLATIFVYDPKKAEWVNVNERMVMLGHAWVMRIYYDHLPRDRQDKLNRLQSWARSKRVGLWSRADPVPPWEWRKSQRGPPAA